MDTDSHLDANADANTGADQEGGRSGADTEGGQTGERRSLGSGWGWWQLEVWLDGWLVGRLGAGLGGGLGSLVGLLVVSAGIDRLCTVDRVPCTVYECSKAEAETGEPVSPDLCCTCGACAGCSW